MQTSGRRFVSEQRGSCRRHTRGTTAGDDTYGCYQFGQGTNQAQGWECDGDTGSAGTITGPSNANGIQVSLAGGQGAEANPASGGYATAVTGTWTVTGGQTLTVTVGQGATDQNPGGGAAGGGKAGGSDGGWGGGNGGGGGAAGGSYTSSDAQAPTMAQANAGGDGSVRITWI